MKFRKASQYRNLKNKLLDALAASSTDARALSIARRLVVVCNTNNAQNRGRFGVNSPVLVVPSLEQITMARAKLRRERLK